MSGRWKTGRFSLADEANKQFKEANVMYWAKSLLQLTYSFIDSAIESSSQSPSFTIPQVRFVDAGLALSYVGGRGKPGAACSAFLIEELIDGSDFVKFIHNMDANPLLDHEDDGLWTLSVQPESGDHSAVCIGISHEFGVYGVLNA